MTIKLELYATNDLKGPSSFLAEFTEDNMHGALGAKSTIIDMLDPTGLTGLVYRLHISMAPGSPLDATTLIKPVTS